MKKFILSCSLLAFGASAYAADTISCNTLPTCEELGYAMTASDCSDRATLKCPFDYSKVFCVEKGAPTCPNGYYKDCQGYSSNYVNDTSKSPVVLSDGSKCYQCRYHTCSDYGYMSSMPSSSQIGSGCSGKNYNSCSSTSVNGLSCVSCTSNPYGSSRNKIVYCSSSQGYAGAGNYCCSSSATTKNCDGTGGCLKME